MRERAQRIYTQDIYDDADIVGRVRAEARGSLSTNSGGGCSLFLALERSVASQVASNLLSANQTALLICQEIGRLPPCVSCVTSHRRGSVGDSFVPAIPQSEVLANILQEIGEECGEILAKFFAAIRPSISSASGRTKFHEKSSTFSTVHQIEFFHCCNSGGWGAQDSWSHTFEERRWNGKVAFHRGRVSREVQTVN